MDGLGVLSKLMGGGRRQIGRQDLVQDDQTLWETEEPAGGFEINSTERCWSKNPGRGVRKRTRRWRRPRKKRQTVISPTPTEQRVVVPPEVPHDTRICIEDLVDIEREKKGHEIDQLREEREV